MRKLTPVEIDQRSTELAEMCCRLAEARDRKSTLSAQLNKEIRYYSEVITKIAQEINAGEIEYDPQQRLPNAGGGEVPGPGSADN
jgi:hypothetical protein